MLDFLPLAAVERHPGSVPGVGGERDLGGEEWEGVSVQAVHPWSSELIVNHRLCSSIYSNMSVRLTMSSTPAGTTMGRKESECGQMGVTMMAGTLGWIMEAPAAAAYAVLPVGVETMTPGATRERGGGELLFKGIFIHINYIKRNINKILCEYRCTTN